MAVDPKKFKAIRLMLGYLTRPTLGDSLAHVYARARARDCLLAPTLL